MEVAVRMGTVMSMQDDMLGHFMVPLAAMRREGTSQAYVDLSYPAVADIELVNVMNETVASMGKVLKRPELHHGRVLQQYARFQVFQGMGQGYVKNV